MGTRSDLQWIVLDDFRPGIFQTVSPKHPRGAAVEDGTYKCHSNPGGDLVPAPDQYDSISLLANLNADEPGGGLYHIVGTHAAQPTFDENTGVGVDQNNTELFCAFDYIIEPDDRKRVLVRFFRHSGGGQEVVYNEPDVFPYTSDYRPPRATMGLTRSNSAAPLEAGPSVLVICQGDGVFRAFPDDTSPGTTGTVNMPAPTAGNPQPDMLIVHQGRVVAFMLTLTGFGDNGVPQIYAHNEFMYWMEVNDVTTLDDLLSGEYFNVVFGYENPAGYDCGASLASNELFLLKRYGGALFLRGDLNFPQAVNLPNVKSPGFAESWGVQTPIGYVYVVDYDGVYLWRGGDTSENLSPMMLRNFWRPIDDVTAPADEWSPNERYRSATQLALWGDWVMLPNNWFYDITNAPGAEAGGGGFWRIDNPSQRRYSFYVTDWTGRWMWASPYAVPHGLVNRTPFFEFDRSHPSTNFNWTSQPLQESQDRQLDVQEVVVVASGTGQVNIGVRGRSVERTEDTTPIEDSVTIEVDSEFPKAFRQRLVTKGELLQVSISSSDPNFSAAAPTIHEVRVGCTPWTKIGRGEEPA